MADQLAPLLEIGRAAEIDGVVLHRVPADEQPVRPGFSTERCNDSDRQPLARLNSGAAPPTPASNSASRPGLTSICAISRTMGHSVAWE